MSIALSITYREVCTYPLIVTFRQFRLANINPTAGFYRGVPWCFLLLFLRTYKLHFYSILVQDEDLKNAEALLRKLVEGKIDLFSSSFAEQALSFHRFTAMFSLTHFLEYLF